MNNDDMLFFPPKNLVTVLSSFFKAFKGNPLEFISMDEAVSMFERDYDLNEDGNYMINDPGIKEFLNKILNVYTARLMMDMDKKGLAVLAHDGNDFFLLSKEDV